MTAPTSSTPPLGKYLASTDKKTRDKAIKNLSIFLSDSSRDVISKHEMTKLWKGIFYCFWMSDKPLVQQALAGELAELILTITTTTSSLAFLRGFWETTVREWNGIDRLRIDKYYMLVRRFVNATFRLLMRTKWDKSACDEYIDILTQQGGPLCPSDMRVPTSLAYHLSDIYIEELDTALGKPPTPTDATLPAPLSVLLTPFFLLAAQTSTNTTYQRIQSSLFEPIFAALSSPTPQNDSDDEPSRKRIRLSSTVPAMYPNLVQNACMDDPKGEGKVEGSILRKRLLRRVFEVASDPDTRDSNRRKMYALWKNGAEDEDEDSG